MNSAPEQTDTIPPPPPYWGLASPGRWLLLVLAAALIARVAYLIVYSNMPDWQHLTVDNYYHHHWAQVIARGDVVGDTTFFRAPFYIWCLGLLYALFGPSLWVGRLFGLAIGMATVAMTYRLGRQVAGPKIGLIGAALAAVYPMQLYFESELLLDPLFSLLLLAAIERTLAWLHSGRIRTAAIAGLSLGLAAITRPTALLLIPIIVIVSLWPERRQSHPKSIRGLLLLLLPVVILVGSVFVRNLVVADDPVLIASQGGINLYIGNNDEADGLSATLPEPLGFNWQIAQITHIAETDLGRDLKPGEVSSYWQDRAVDWITDNPLQFLDLYGRKLLSFLGDREVSNNRALGPFFASHRLLDTIPISFAWLLAAGAIALVFRWRSQSTYLLPLLTIVVYIAVMALFFYNSRFRLPLLPYLYTFTAVGIATFIEAITARSRRLWPMLAVAVAVLITAHIPRHVTAEPPSAQPLVSQGLHYQAQGRHQRALELFHQASQIDSTFPELHLNIGVSHLRRGNIRQAESEFRKEITLHPARHRAYTNLASLALLSDQPDSARYYAQRALDLAPYDITANRAWLRALSRTTSPRDESFTTAADRALARTDTSIYVALEAGLLAMTRQHPDITRRYLTLAANAIRPPVETDDAAFGPHWQNSPSMHRQQQAHAWYQLGYLAGLNRDFEKAVKLTRRAIERDSLLVEAWVNLISGYAAIGDIEQAQTTLQRAEQLFPDNELIQSIRQHQ